MSELAMSELSCAICLEPFLCHDLNRKPTVVCRNGHTFCRQCSSRFETCPTCRAEILESLITNIALMKVVEQQTEALHNIPEIRSDEITRLSEEPLAMGSYADVFLCKWNDQEVAIKRLRVHPQTDQMKTLKIETSLAISLLHPSIIRVYGSVTLEGGMQGIVMEYADRGSLGQHLTLLTMAQKVRVATAICDGIAYLHSKRVAHRDLKPDNILLFGSLPTAKISDFGTSKVIQTIVTNTSMAGTPKYTAPELLEEGNQYDSSVDLFSLAMILYEMFSEQDPFPGCNTVIQILTALIRDKRPGFPANFPHQLIPVIEKGWARDPKERGEIKHFQNALEPLKRDEEYSRAPRLGAALQSTVNAAAQVAEVSRTTMPVPLISLSWPQQCEVGESRQLRANMAKNVKERSNMKTMIGTSVIKALEAVPRHLFMQSERIPGSAMSAKLKHVYTYNKAMGATPISNESSPEIIGVQLSLVKFDTGSNVLLVGGKGGYIGSVVTQIVGINGMVVTVSTKQEILDLCKIRVERNSPLARVMEWKLVNSVSDIKSLANSLDDYDPFHAIIFCGSTSVLPTDLLPKVLPGGSIIAPIKLGDSQQLQLIIKGADIGDSEIRRISEFGVIFEEVQ